MEDERTYSVYMHTCLAEGNSLGKVYVGLTSRDPCKRWGTRGQYYKHCLYFDHAINKYGWNKFAHEVVATGLTKEEAKATEKEFIRRYQSNNPEFGFNLTRGGDTATGAENPKSRGVVLFDISTGERVAEYETLSEASRSIGCGVYNCLWGQCKTAGKHYIARYAEDVIGVERIEVSERLKYRGHPEKERPVYQYDMRGNFLRDYPSIEEAEKQLGLSRGVVANAVRGKSKSGGGYQWRYADNAPLYIPPWVPGSETRWANGSYAGKPIDQIDLKTGAVIHTFASTHEAERITGIRRSTICMVLRPDSGKHSAGGYGWQRHSER